MGIWPFLSKFTVLEPEDCSALFPISLKRFCSAGSWLPLPLFLCLVAPATWADEASTSKASTSKEVQLPLEMVSEVTVAPIAPPSPAAHPPVMLPSLAPASPGYPRSPLPEIPLTPSKTQFLQQKPSRQATDLLTPPSSRNAKISAPIAAPTHEWLVAATQLPLLEQSPPDPWATPSNDQGQGGRSPIHRFQLAGVRVAADPGNPVLPPVFGCPNPDPELGCIRIQDAPGPTTPPPILYLTPRVDFFRSNNLLLGIDPINAGLIRPSLTLLAIPRIGPNTYVLASVDGAFNRYFEVPQFSYDELRVRAGILHQLSPTMTAEVGWTNQQLFIANNEIPGFPSGTRFLNDQAVRFELSRRDQLTERLSLNSIYQFRVSFSDPEDRSRILNVAFLSLNWDLNPNRTVQLGMDYQFSAANYTVVKRTDIYQQLLGRITFNAFRNSQLSLYGGISFGDSTEPGIDFNSYVLGVSMSVNWTLF